MFGRLLFRSKGHDAVVSYLNFALMNLLKILGTRIKFHNFIKISTKEPLIIVSNHQSMWDIPPIMWLFRKHHPKFIAKKELSRFIPSISFNINYGGSIAIDRKKPHESIERIRGFGKNNKENNFSICIFPEGTRTRDGKVRKFKTGGVEALIEEMPNALIVPVAIKNTGQIDNNTKYLKKLWVKVSYTQLKPRKISLDSVKKELDIIREEIKEIVES